MFVRPFVLLSTLTLVAGSASAAQATKKLDAAACRAAAPREAERLPPEWAAFAPHVRVCEVSGGGERAALTIATAFAEDYYRSFSKKLNKELVLPRRKAYPRAMSTSIGTWPGAMSKGDKTVWDPWGNDATFGDVRFWAEANISDKVARPAERG